MKKFLSLSLIVLLCMGMLAGCGGGDTNNDANAGDVATIKIGGTAPLTGGAAIYGNAVKQAAELAVEEVNALGGVQFELKYEDDVNDAEKAVNAFNSLKDWGMQISLGSVTSTPAVATADISMNDSIFTITPSGSSPKVIEGKTNVFQMCFSDPNQGSASAQYMADHQLGTKIAVIYKNDEVYSSGIYEKFMEKAKELNLNVVSVSTFTADSQNDFSVQLAAAKNEGADLLFLPIYYEAASLILTQADSMDYNPVIFGVDGMDGILGLNGFDTALAEDVILLTPFSADAEDELTKNFVANYKDRYGDVPNQFAADVYDCIYALHDACTKGGVTADMTAADINTIMIEQFTNMTFDGLTGEGMTWDTTGAVSKSPKAMVIKDGVYVGM